MVTDHGGLTSNVGVYAKAAGLEPGKVFFAGFDMSPNTAQAIEQGYQSLVIDQQPFLQGYLSIVNICLTKKYGFSGLAHQHRGRLRRQVQRRRRGAAGGRRNPLDAISTSGAGPSSAPALHPGPDR